jgi:hypothetical protein
MERKIALEIIEKSTEISEGLLAWRYNEETGEFVKVKEARKMLQDLEKEFIIQEVDTIFDIRNEVVPVYEKTNIVKISGEALAQAVDELGYGTDFSPNVAGLVLCRYNEIMKAKGIDPQTRERI